MKTIELVQNAGPDHVLHLDIPVEDERRYRVVINLSLDQDSVVKNGKTTAQDTLTAKPGLPAGFHAHPGWPAGFWETVFGAWEGDFVRDQGEYEERASW